MKKKLGQSKEETERDQRDRDRDTEKEREIHSNERVEEKENVMERPLPIIFSQSCALVEDTNFLHFLQIEH